MEYISRILIIDDDDTSIFLSRKIVSDMYKGADVQTAQNGLEGLRLLKEAMDRRLPFQLILLDVNMQGMTGLALLEELGKRQLVNLIDTKIVLLTSSLNPLHIASAIGHMGASYLPKPLSKRNLLRVLD